MEDSLFMRIADASNLMAAWKSVLAKNSSGGADGVSLGEFGSKLSKNLSSLRQSLVGAKWCPHPYLKVVVPKHDGSDRELGMMSVQDKVVQTAIKQIVEPVLERTFLSSSYAYRPGRGHVACVKRALHETRAHKDGFVVRCDIDNFFPSIDRELLMKRLEQVIKSRRTLELIDLCISIGRVENDLQWEDKNKGLPQGAILSPLLANFYLNPFDQSLLSKGTAYVRYSDDIVIWTNCQDDALSITSHVSSFLSERMDLALNEVPCISPCSEPFEFLGLIVSPGGLSITEEKEKELTELIRNIKMDGESPTKEYMKGIHGIRRYYLSVLPSSYHARFSKILENVSAGWLDEGRGVSKKTVSLIKKELLDNVPKPVIRDSSGGVVNAVDKKKILAMRKSEYRKLESENSELVISGTGYFIGAGYCGITVRKSGQVIKMNTASVKHISILSHGVGISSNLVEYCGKHGIGIDFFGEHCSHLASLQSPLSMNSDLRLRQVCIDGNADLEMAKSIIVGKIRNQLNLCKYFNKYHKGKYSETEFEAICARLQDCEKSVRAVSDVGPDGKKSIMGYEALAAETYWCFIGWLLQDDGVEFYSRVKQGAKDVFNSMLNYGYSLLYPRIWQALLRRGFDPYIGFVHHAAGNPNLVFDVIELFRCQAVDRIVVGMLQKKEKCGVDTEGKIDGGTKELLAGNVMTRLYRYELFRGERRRFLDIIDLQVASLAESIVNGVKFRPYIAKW